MDIIIKPLISETLSLFKDCFEANGTTKNEKHLKWQFFDNPPKSCYVDIAYDNEAERTAAVYAISSIFFKVGNMKSVIATQSLDTMTDSSYRGKGFFTKLARNVYKTAISDGVSLVYGFPNGSSIHGFKRKLEWENLDPVPFLIKPLKSKYFTKKIKFLKFLPNLNLSIRHYKPSKSFKLLVSNDFPEEVNSIWNIFSKHFQVGLVRDKNYLDWRYLSKPNESYKIVHCYSQDQVYLGYIVYVIKEKHNGKIAYIMELIFDTNISSVGDALLKFAISDIKKNNADCILSWCMSHSPNFKTFSKRLFVNMPSKIRPIELHFGARSFDETLKPLINNRANWYLSYSDSDTV